MNKSLRTCFVIGPIGTAGSEIRIRSDRVLNKLVSPVLNDFDFEVVRADRISALGEITGQIIRHVANDHLVIADLTGANPNVLYELAIRHCVRKPVLTVFESGHPIPFDVASFRALEIVSESEGGLSVARDQLRSQLAELLQQGESSPNPISETLPAWTFCAPAKMIQRELVDSLILTYLTLSFTMGHRPHLPEDQRAVEARPLIRRLESQLQVLTDLLGMSPPSTFYELEKFQWKAARGEP